jgi:DNA-directed RNA polymerase specialized sigma24 family protein
MQLSHRDSTVIHPPRFGLGARLDDEWVWLRSRPANLRHAEGWAIVEGSMQSLDQVLAAVGYQVTATIANERALHHLLRLAAADQLAARVVMQRIIPGLFARLRGNHQQPSVAAADELIGAAWIAIRTFNPSRRVACLAAALIDDAVHRAFRAQARKGQVEHATGFDQERLPAVEHDNPAFERLTQLLDLAQAAGLATADLDLIRAIANDYSPSDLARAMKVTVRTVRNRRDRVTRQLREVAMAA